MNTLLALLDRLSMVEEDQLKAAAGDECAHRDLRWASRPIALDAAIAAYDYAAKAQDEFARTANRYKSRPDLWHQAWVEALAVADLACAVTATAHRVGVIHETDDVPSVWSLGSALVASMVRDRDQQAFDGWRRAAIHRRAPTMGAFS
jgi:hypothetical protein